MPSFTKEYRCIAFHFNHFVLCDCKMCGDQRTGHVEPQNKVDNSLRRVVALMYYLPVRGQIWDLTGVTLLCNIFYGEGICSI